MLFRFTVVIENLVPVTPFESFKKPGEVTKSALIPEIM